MFTVKPANDEEEFHEAIALTKDVGIAQSCRERYQSTLYLTFIEAIRNPPNLPPPAAPSSSEANTSLSPSPPHVVDAP